MASLKTLVRRLRSPDTDEAFLALADLLLRATAMGERPPEVLPELLRRAADPDTPLKVRQLVVNALPVYGPTDDAARDAVVRALADPSPFVRREALQSLTRMRNLREPEFAAIRGMAADPDKHVARWSETALRNIALREQQDAEPGAAADGGSRFVSGTSSSPVPRRC